MRWDFGLRQKARVPFAKFLDNVPGMDASMGHPIVIVLQPACADHITKGESTVGIDKKRHAARRALLLLAEPSGSPSEI